MLKFFNKQLNNNKGFTLIELLVVIAIIGILAAIAIPRLTGFTDRAAISADEATARTIENAIQLYYATETDKDISDINGAKITFTGEDHTPAIEDHTDLLNELVKLVELTPPQQSGKEKWEITVAAGDDVKVEAAD